MTTSGPRPGTIGDLLARMDELLEPLAGSNDSLRYFLATYTRTTRAVKQEIERGGFLDREWTEAWDVAFADLYLEALERWRAGASPPGPWKIAFEAARSEDLPPVRHVLLGMNAHVNYDLPQALLAVITDEQFDDPGLIARRWADHTHIDAVLVRRVPEEDKELEKVERPGDRTLLDRALAPFNRAGTRKFLKEARVKVWQNAKLLSRARREGADALEVRLRELERLSQARVADLRAPGQVLLRLTRKGFGVSLED